MARKRNDGAASDIASDAPSDAASASEDDEARRRAVRDNARRVLRASGVPELLRILNRQALKGRGVFEEYDSSVLFKWGTGYTRRHIWVEVVDDAIRFRLREHLRCKESLPVCDGEYHTFPRETWGDRSLIEREIQRAYEHPVAEASDD